MRAGFSRVAFFVILALQGWGVQAVYAVPFYCTPQPCCGPPTALLAQQVAEADFVLVGTVLNKTAEPMPSDFVTADVTIVRVIKHHPNLEGRRQITVSRFPREQDKPVLIFGEVQGGKMQARDWLPNSPDMEKYLLGAIHAHQANGPLRLCYYSLYLNHQNSHISCDATRVFELASHRDILVAAKSFDADQLVAWMLDKDLPFDRSRLLGYLVGTCKRAEDVRWLRQLLDSNLDAIRAGGNDGLMVGLYLLSPAEGLEYATACLKDAKKTFGAHYSALSTLRFLLDEIGDANRDKIVESFGAALGSEDIADYIIGELRKRKIWTFTEQVLALGRKPGFDNKHIWESVICYSVQCPDGKAKEFLTDERLRRKEAVSNVEELLRLSEQWRKENTK